jgi:plastocyanin
MKFRIRAALLVAVAAMSVVGLAACGGDDDDGGTTTPEARTPGGTTATKPATNGGENGEAEEIAVSMKDNFFEPKEITVKVGKTVEFKTKNDGTAIHNMKILSKAAEGKDFMSDQIVNPGDDSDFKATFTKTGTYDFQCDYHVPDMVGVIKVVD